MTKEIESELLADRGAITEETTKTLKYPTARQMKSSSPSPIQWQGNAKEYYTRGGRAVSPPPMSGGGERDDGYFDAHPWFDSDNEEFRSVNGDFGSSRSLMNRIDSEADPDTQASATPQVLLNRSSTSSNTGYLPDVRPSASSSSVKKQLIEFFSESFSRDLRTEMAEEEESISKQPLASFHKYSTPSSTSTDRSTTSPRESVFGDPGTATTTNRKSVVKASCILLVRSLSCGGGGNVADGGKKKRSRRHDFKH